MACNRKRLSALRHLQPRLATTPHFGRPSSRLFDHVSVNRVNQQWRPAVVCILHPSKPHLLRYPQPLLRFLEQVCGPPSSRPHSSPINVHEASIAPLHRSTNGRRPIIDQKLNWVLFVRNDPAGLTNNGCLQSCMLFP